MGSYDSLSKEELIDELERRDNEAEYEMLRTKSLQCTNTLINKLSKYGTTLARESTETIKDYCSDIALSLTQLATIFEGFEVVLTEKMENETK